jgi:hypothetical protein
MKRGAIIVSKELKKRILVESIVNNSLGVNTTHSVVY